MLPIELIIGLWVFISLWICCLAIRGLRYFKRVSTYKVYYFEKFMVSFRWRFGLWRVTAYGNEHLWIGQADPVCLGVWR